MGFGFLCFVGLRCGFLIWCLREVGCGWVTCGVFCMVGFGNSALVLWLWPVVDFLGLRFCAMRFGVLGLAGLVRIYVFRVFGRFG